MGARVAQQIKCQRDLGLLNESYTSEIVHVLPPLPASEADNLETRSLAKGDTTQRTENKVVILNGRPNLWAKNIWTIALIQSSTS